MWREVWVVTAKDNGRGRTGAMNVAMTRLLHTHDANSVYEFHPLRSTLGVLPRYD